MINTSNAKWNLSSKEKTLIHWLDDNGFDGRIKMQFVSKIVLEVSRNGVNNTIEFSDENDTNIKTYLKQYEKNFNELVELKELRKQVVASK